MNTILLVEDDPALRILYQETLTAAGFTLETATNGQEALAKMTAGSFDLILLDIMMPVMDGITTLKKLKDFPAPPTPRKIVMLTSMNDDVHIKEALSNGADGYLMKTALSPEQVVAEVKTFLAPVA